MLEEELAERANAKKAIAEKWNKYKLLDHHFADDPFAQMDLTLILENQRLFDETHNDHQFKRISIPICMRILKRLIINKIASVQPLFDKKDDLFYLTHEGNKTFMEKQEVEAKEYRLKTVWNYEVSQDLRSHNGLDAEAELTAILAQEVTLELDRRSLLTMSKFAGTNWTWDFATSLGDTIKEKYESLYMELHTVSKQIEAKTGRGKANWIVTSPEIASIFETVSSGFAYVDSDTWSASLGISYCGTINGKWKLYKDPLFQPNNILMGYKGNHPYDAGYIFGPRILLKQTPMFLDPDSFTPRKGLITEYSDKIIPGGEDFYANIKVANFII